MPMDSWCYIWVAYPSVNAHVTFHVCTRMQQDPVIGMVRGV